MSFKYKNIVLLCNNILYLFYPPECLLKTKNDSNDNEACSTTSDMTDNPAYGTTSGIMASLSYTTAANVRASKDEESIVIHKNPIYGTAAGTMCNMYRDN